MSSGILRGAVLLMAAASVSTAQSTQFPFQLSVSSGGNTVLVADGATIAFSALIGSSQAAKVTALYRGTGMVTIAQKPNLFGSAAFTVSFPSSLPLVLNSGEQFSFTITYSPQSTSQTSAQVDLPFTETLPPAAGSSSPTQNLGDINFVLQGFTPSFSLSYILQTDQNVVSLQPGGTIPFKPTLINTAAQALLNITNVGTGAGQVTNITIVGSAFKLAGLPLFPASVAAGANLQLAINYSPTAVGNDTGQIQITLDPQTTITINLQGSGIKSTFLYQVLEGTNTISVAPGGSAKIPDTNVGVTTNVTIRVKNTSVANGTVNSIDVVGQGFELTSAILLPQTLAPNASLSFTVAFTPTQPGQETAQVIVGNDQFELVGNGIGPNLVFSYVSDGTTITLDAANPAVVFSPVMISQSATTTFLLKNTGTQAAIIANIGIGAANSPYSLRGLPALPISLAPNKQIKFTINFAPTTAGFSNGTLVINTVAIPLTGSGTQPPTLPAYTIQGPSGNASPLTQPAISLQLSAPYPVALAGTLTISISGDLTNDPSVQFVTGGRQVQFLIPANSTNATFADQGTQINLQTGTVASTVTLTPTFATQAGGVDVTPSSPATLQFVIPAEGPVLLDLSTSSQGSNTIVLSVSGFSTTRSLSNMTVQFAIASGFTVTTSQITVDLSGAAATWFNSSASVAFGGQFVIQAPFTFQGTAPSGQTVLNSVTGATVTISNAQGTSNTLQVAL
jgi:hypothetical protein